MPLSTVTPATHAGPAPIQSLRRLECHCQPQRPVLLAMLRPDGLVSLKLRDRHFLITGEARTACPLCGHAYILRSITQEGAPR
jgi:hypothetical protein